MASGRPVRARCNATEYYKLYCAVQRFLNMTDAMPEHSNTCTVDHLHRMLDVRVGDHVSNRVSQSEIGPLLLYYGVQKTMNGSVRPEFWSFTLVERRLRLIIKRWNYQTVTAEQIECRKWDVYIRTINII